MENMPQLQLTRATPDDAPAIRQMVRDAYAKWVPIFGREPMPMTADYDKAVREHEVDGSNPSGVTTGVQTQLLFLRPNPDVYVVSWGMRDGRLTGVGARLAGNGRCGPTFAGEYCFQKTGTKLRQAPESNTNRKRVRYHRQWRLHQHIPQDRSAGR